MLFSAFLSLIGPAHAGDHQGQLDCANLRSTALQLVGDWSKDLLFASRDMNRNGWLDANVASSAFKDVQLAVMHFDYARTSWKILTSTLRMWTIKTTINMSMNTKASTSRVPVGSWIYLPQRMNSRRRRQGRGHFR